MSKAVEISDDVYTQLERQANTSGLTVAQVIAQLAQEVERTRVAMAVARLQAKGILLDAPKSTQTAQSDFTPIRVQGKPLSEVIVEERR